MQHDTSFHSWHNVRGSAARVLPTSARTTDGFCFEEQDNYRMRYCCCCSRSHLQVAEHVLQLPHDAIFRWHPLAISEAEHTFSKLRNHEQLRPGFHRLHREGSIAKQSKARNERQNASATSTKQGQHEAVVNGMMMTCTSQS